MKPLSLTIAARTVRIASLVFICSFSVVARQSALAKTGVTPKDLQTWAARMVFESTASDGVWANDVMPAVSPTVLKALQAMTPAEKLAVTQEVLAAIKATVMAPAFRAEHTARIGKQGNRAIDHGVDALRHGTGTAAADTAATVIPIIQMMQSFPLQALQGAFDEDRAQAAETIKEETGEERAKAQKYLAQLNAVAPLLKSNPDEFKKQYLVAKSASMGGPDTDAKLQAAIAGQGDVREDPERAGRLGPLQPERDSPQEPDEVHRSGDHHGARAPCGSGGHRRGGAVRASMVEGSAVAGVGFTDRSSHMSRTPRIVLLVAGLARRTHHVGARPGTTSLQRATRERENRHYGQPQEVRRRIRARRHRARVWRTAGHAQFRRRSGVHRPVLSRSRDRQGTGDGRDVRVNANSSAR